MKRKGEGYQKLWAWFGLSKASWLSIPRSMMHHMPDEWQDKMADLMEEWDSHWDWEGEEGYGTRVQVTKSGKLTKTPEWMLNYRHPDEEKLNSLERPPF